MADLVVRGVRLHYQRIGVAGGTPVVFLHGLVMDNLASWYFTAANALASDADVLLYDLRGHGKSDRPATGYTLADMVADLAALLDATLGRRAVHLVGNSFGGLLAVAFALRFPSRAAGLVLVDAHLGDEGFGERMARTLELQGEERDRQIALHFKDWLGRHSERKRSRLAESARALVTGTSLVHDVRQTRPVRGEDLARLNAPVLALYGERSDLRGRSELLLRRVPRCTVRVLPGCTHSVLWEATAQVREAVLDLVRGEAATAASA